MKRNLGALAVLGGWLCIPLSGVFGLFATSLLDLEGHRGGPEPGSVYGLSEENVLAVVVIVSLASTFPVAVAMLLRDPSRMLYAGAAAMGLAGIALLPDGLGRIHSIALIPGAGLLALGGRLLHEAAVSRFAAEGDDVAAAGLRETNAKDVGAEASATEAAGTEGGLP
jgi:hypothetical protein